MNYEGNELKEFSPEQSQLSGKILELAFKVHTKLGVGLLESVYEECLYYELRKTLEVVRQAPINIEYEDLKIANAFKADLVVENRVIIELKTVDTILPLHEAQILNYMHLMKKPIGLLLNFKTKSLKYGIKRYTLKEYEHYS